MQQVPDISSVYIERRVDVESSGGALVENPWTLGTGAPALSYLFNFCNETRVVV